MVDLRLKRMASVLVHYCLDLKKGENLLISSSDIAAPLVREVYREALQAGAYPATSISICGLNEIFYTYASDEQLDHVSDFEKYRMEFFDAFLNILGNYNTRALTDIDPSRISRHTRMAEELNNIVVERMKNGNVKICTTQYPTHASAQEASMSYFNYENFVYQACFLNDEHPVESWKNLSRWQAKIIDYLSKHDEIKVVAPDTELSLRTGGRKWINSDGKNNFPDGEVFTGPVENSVEGHIRFSFPGIYCGKEIENIFLEFREGRVVNARADVGQQLLLAMLDTDEGARYVGEFAIGTNYAIDRFTRNMLFDEKIGGTIHLALGLGIPSTGSVNKSVIHWDMLCDMKNNGEIYADGELFYRNGKFIKEF